jgi:acyl-CoA thioester hydrolase
MQEHSIELRVRYDEVDAMGFVHHSNYLRYFEIGRTEMLRAGGGNYRELEESGHFVVVVRLDCRYRSPARYDDLICVHTRIEKVTSAKIVHVYTITRDDTIVAEANVTLAVIDRNGKVQRIPHTLLTSPARPTET